MSRSVALARIWSYLTNGQLGGYRFERQTTINGTPVGMVCPRCKVVVDLVDELPATSTDAELARAGYHILRFTEQAVMCHIDDVCAMVLEACRRASPRRPGRPLVFRVLE